MNPITLANLKNFCRVCLRELSLPETKNTYEKPLTTELVKIVTTITLDESLVTQICRSCCIRVVALYNFREKAIVSTGICKMLIAEFVKEDSLPRLKSYCRICLQRRTGEKDERYSLKENVDLCTLMFQCIGLQLKYCKSIEEDMLANDERFPDVVCEKCFIGFSNFTEVRSLAKLSEEYVQNLLDEEKAFMQEKKLASQLEEEFVESPDQNELNFLKLEELKIKVEPLDLIANVHVEDQNSNVEESSTIIHNEQPVNQDELSEKEIQQDFMLENNVTDSQHTTTTDNESDQLFDLKTDKTKVKIKQNTRRCHQLECQHCGKKFRNRIHYDGHVKGTHEGVENPFGCNFEMCDKHFADNNALQRHITRKHKANEAKKKSWEGNIFEPPKKTNIHVCLQCNRQFTRKSHVLEHQNSVHLNENERPFKCQFCQKSFGSKKTLERHEKNHSNEKPFACEFCPKRYNIKADFNAHMQRHKCNDQNSHLLCPICKRIKSTPEELKAHIEMHMKSRQHQCETCGKIFTKLFHLKEHETSVHLKLRPFKCAICEKTFATQRSQKEHEQLHDPNAEKKVLCEICEMGFISRKQLSYHKAKDHKPEKRPVKSKEIKRNKTKKNQQNEGTATIAPFPLDWLS